MLQIPLHSPKKTAITGWLNTLSKPEVKAVQDSNWEKQSACDQKAPKTF
jgi:hypothetical protein